MHVVLQATVENTFGSTEANIGDKALGKQADQKNYHDLHSRDRQFTVGQKVMAQNFLQGMMLVPGVITEVCGPVSYMVRVQPNIVWR